MYKIVYKKTSGETSTATPEDDFIRNIQITELKNLHWIRKAESKDYALEKPDNTFSTLNQLTFRFWVRCKQAKCYDPFFQQWKVHCGVLPMLSHYSTHPLVAVTHQDMQRCACKGREEEDCTLLNMDINNAGFKHLRRISSAQCYEGGNAFNMWVGQQGYTHSVF